MGQRLTRFLPRFDHARHFLNACKRLMGMPHKSVQGGVTGVEYEGRTVMVVVRHVSVEPGKILRALGGDATLREIEALDLTLQPLMAKKPKVVLRAAKESEIPNFKGSYLGRFPLVSADFWTSDHLSERSRSVDAFSGTRARGTLTLKRR